MDSRKTIILLLAVLFSFSVQAEPKFGPTLHTKWVTKLKKEKLITRRPYQFSTPVFSDSKIYVGTSSGYFYAIDSEKGLKDWRIKLAGGVYSEPAVEGNNIYAADRKGIVYSIAKDSGKIEWQVETGAEISSKPIVTEDTLYFATMLRQIVALSKNGTGKKWQTTKTGTLPQMTIKGSSSPLLYNGNIYVGYADGMIMCYKASDGNPIWARQLSRRESMFVDVDTSPLIDNGVIYISSSDGRTYALNPLNGETIWEINKGGPNDLANDLNYIYISGNGRLSAVKKDSGILVWEQDFQEPEISAPVLKDGYIAVASTKDKIYVVSAESGDIKFKRFLGKGCFGKPIIIENMLYILTNSSRLFALQGV